MNKQPILLIALLLFSGISFSQNVQFPPSILAAGGSIAPSGSVTITRWRLAKIHVLTISDVIKSEENSSDDLMIMPPESVDWSANVYPNPVGNQLTVSFLLNRSTEFRFEIWDIAGKRMLRTEKQNFVAGQKAEFDLRDYKTGLYLLKIMESEIGRSRVYKISKF